MICISRDDDMCTNVLNSYLFATSSIHSLTFLFFFFFLLFFKTQQSKSRILAGRMCTI